MQIYNKPVRVIKNINKYEIIVITEVADKLLIFQTIQCKVILFSKY